MFRDIDTKLLIRLVENRPVLWDKTLEYYRFKQAHALAWKEICLKLHDGYDSLPEIEKRDFGKQVVNRWNNVRDNWIRCHKKLIDYKTGGGEKVNKYKFYEPMKFLAKVVTYRATELSLLTFDESSKESCNDSDECEIPKKKKIQFTDIAVGTDENRTEPTVNVPTDQEEKHGENSHSRIMYFFKSIAPTIEKYKDDDLVEFQFEVVKTMREISRRSRLSHTNDSDAEDQKNIITFDGD